MEDEKQSKDKFMIILLALFIIFLIIYITKEVGYYEIKAYRKVALTQESIEKFEQDIEDGKNVTIKDYVVSDYKDYSNVVTDFGYNVGKLTENVMNNGIKKTLDVLGKLFYE